MLAIQGSTVYQNYDNKGNALFIQFIENKRPLHVSSITCSSSGGFTQTELGILRAYNVSCLCHDCSFTATLYARNIPSAVCAETPADEQVMLETCKGP
jgi:hypothetical protein